jgi:predicted SnoaL-like aldol condensation-catalyzing enzyme
VHGVRVPGRPGTAIVDIFRLDADGKIVEHWDVMQPVPGTDTGTGTGTGTDTGAVANSNGMF